MPDLLLSSDVLLIVDLLRIVDHRSNADALPEPIAPQRRPCRLAGCGLSSRPFARHPDRHRRSAAPEADGARACGEPPLGIERWHEGTGMLGA